MSRLNKGAAEQRFPLPALLQKLACAMAVALALVCAGAYAPTTAQALETAKITARPNTGSGSAVVGGTETRITWEVQADADEELSGLSLTFVDGTTFGTDDTRLTMLSGEDLMDRTPMKPTCKADGQTLKIDFGETAPAGGFFRVEVYGVAFHSILGLESLKLSWWQFQPGFARFWPSWLFGSGCAFRQASAQA